MVWLIGLSIFGLLIVNGWNPTRSREVIAKMILGAFAVFVASVAMINADPDCEVQVDTRGAYTKC